MCSVAELRAGDCVEVGFDHDASVQCGGDEQCVAVGVFARWWPVAGAEQSLEFTNDRPHGGFGGDLLADVVEQDGAGFREVAGVHGCGVVLAEVGDLPGFLGIQRA